MSGRTTWKSRHQTWAARHDSKWKFSYNNSCQSNVKQLQNFDDLQRSSCMLVYIDPLNHRHDHAYVYVVFNVYCHREVKCEAGTYTTRKVVYTRFKMRTAWFQLYTVGITVGMNQSSSARWQQLYIRWKSLKSERGLQRHDSVLLSKKKHVINSLLAYSPSYDMHRVCYLPRGYTQPAWWQAGSWMSFCILQPPAISAQRIHK
jgi:hypothetical protein